MFLQRLFIGAIAITAMVAMPLVVAAAAQWPHHGWHHGGMYDVRTETRVTGTVEAVNNLTCPNEYCWCGAGGGGTHVTLKTANESIEVHLGPAAWLREQGISLTAGDTVEVLGSRIAMRGVPALLAREVKKGETTWTLFAGQGRRGWGPCWH